MQRQKVSLFCPPKDPALLEEWKKAISRVDRILTRKDSICSKHFEKELVMRDWTAELNGTIIMKVDMPAKLAKNIVPTIFPDRLPEKRFGKSKLSGPAKTMEVQNCEINHQLVVNCAGEECTVRDNQNLNPSKFELPVVHVKDSKVQNDCSGVSELLVECADAEPTGNDNLDIFDWSVFLEKVNDIVLPNSAWNIHKYNLEQRQYIAFTQLGFSRKKNCVGIQKQLIVDEYFGYNVFILSQIVLLEETVPICDIASVQKLLDKLEKLNVCRGASLNPELASISTQSLYNDDFGGLRYLKCSLLCSNNELLCKFCSAFETKFHIPQTKISVQPPNKLTCTPTEAKGVVLIQRHATILKENKQIVARKKTIQLDEKMPQQTLNVASDAANESLLLTPPPLPNAVIDKCLVTGKALRNSDRDCYKECQLTCSGMHDCHPNTLKLHSKREKSEIAGSLLLHDISGQGIKSEPKEYDELNMTTEAEEYNDLFTKTQQNEDSEFVLEPSGGYEFPLDPTSANFNRQFQSLESEMIFEDHGTELSEDSLDEQEVIPSPVQVEIEVDVSAMHVTTVNEKVNLFGQKYDYADCGYKSRNKIMGCLHCKKVFMCFEDLRKHHLNHEKVHIQNMCSLEKNLNTHDLPYSEAYPLIHSCGKHSKPTENMKQRSLKLLVEYSCKLCSKVYSRKSHLSRHSMLVHTGEKLYACPFCGKKFLQKRSLNMHLLLQPGDNTGYSECKKRFSEEGNWEKFHKCNICGEAFSQAEQLETHKSSHFDGKLHHCSQCGKYFKQKHILKRHMLVHSGEKSFRCGDCGTVFARKGALTRHALFRCKKKKSDENAVSLETNLGDKSGYSECTKRFNKEGNWEKFHNCNICGQAFSQADHLETHKLSHFDSKLHHYSRCGKYLKKQQLKKHMLVNSGEKSFSCGDCGNVFARKGALTRHALFRCKRKKSDEYAVSLETNLGTIL